MKIINNYRNLARYYHTSGCKLILKLKKYSYRTWKILLTLFLLIRPSSRGPERRSRSLFCRAFRSMQNSPRLYLTCNSSQSTWITFIHRRIHIYQSKSGIAQQLMLRLKIVNASIWSGLQLNPGILHSYQGVTYCVRGRGTCDDVVVDIQLTPF